MSKYTVHDKVCSNDEQYDFPTFWQAKQKLDEIMDEYDEVGMFRSPDIKVQKVSDVMWKFYGRNSGYQGCVYIKKNAA